VDETYLIRFERSATPSRPLFRVGNDCVLDSLSILPDIVAYHPRVEVIDKAYGPTVLIDRPLDQIGVIEDVEERRKG
jgi:hypothetical protein